MHYRNVFILKTTEIYISLAEKRNTEVNQRMLSSMQLPLYITEEARC